ncbi:MAG: OmpA family protein [Bacteroidota bacterium]
MKVNFLSTVLCGGLLVFATLIASAQGDPMPGKENVLRDRSVLLKDEDAIMARTSTFMLFPNVNKVPFYLDKKAIGTIRDYEKDGSIEVLEAALDAYISQFGIENFRRDVKMLWLAGRVKQLQGDTARAIFFYDLAQTHNRNLQIPRLTYDSLKAPYESEWLPIDKYYELLEVRKRIDPLIPPKNVLTKMTNAINSEDPEYAPYMHPSDSILIFTSRKDGSGMRTADFVDPFTSLNEDLYYAEIDFVSGEWRPAEKLPDTINTQFNEGSATLAPDGRTLYFTRCRDLRGFGDCDIYEAVYDGVSWSKVTNLGKNVNSLSWDSQPNVTPDGQVLFFASNRKGGFGGTDIYMTEKDENGKWGPARNLGPIINTPREEVTPYFHRINNTLYFSSTGHLMNFGSFDIFKSRWILDRWEYPQNVGPLVNTKGNEYYFSLDGDGETIFYANARDPEEDHIKQNFDLYSFPMPMEAMPDAIAQLKGVLIDSVSGHVLQGTVMLIDLDNGREIAPKKINENGYFEFNLKNDNRYRLFVLGDNFLTIEQEFQMKGDTSFQVMTQSFEENKPIVFEAMEFKSASSRLLLSTRPKLDYIVRFLKNYPMFKLEVEGHTDSDGDEDDNLLLSQSRASSIRAYILKKGGFDEDKVSATGYGETRPIVPNDTEENKSKNRRVEFKLVLDELYDGDLWLPTEKELFFDDSLDEGYDENETIDDGFEMTDAEKKDWEEEIEMDDELLDLEAELEADILLKSVEKTTKKPAPKKKGGGGK